MARANIFLACGIILLTILGAASFTAVAHPGSGIVVDAKGNVFFQDSAARTIWKIDPQGKVTAHHDKLGGHWIALDAKGKFARANLKLVEWIAPALIVADGGAPITLNTDGNLYYGLGVSSTGQVRVGMTRIFPDGKHEPFAPDFARHIEKLGITGLASGPDGTLYVACLTGVLKVKTDGTFTTLANPIAVKDCDQDAPTSFLRGLDVDSHGIVYAAASGCRGVVKITTDGKVETVLKAERPWSPTGIAVQGDEIYVLEYTNANLSEGWLPRVRKLGRDGKITTLATISKERQSAQPNRQILQSANSPQTAPREQAAIPPGTPRCSDLDLEAVLQPTNKAYSMAMELAQTLQAKGFIIKCVLRSKMEDFFEELEGAALFRTTRGSFEALFLPKPKTFDKLIVLERTENGRYIYSFEGDPKPAPWTGIDSARPIYFVKHDH